MPSAKLTLGHCSIDATASLDDIYALLALRGGIIVKGAFGHKMALQMRAELQPQLDRQAEADKKSAYTGAFFPSTTVKVGALLTRSDTFARNAVTHPIFHGLAQKVLTRRDKMPLAPGGVGKWTTAQPQINVTSVLQIHPGAAAQTLHRDDMLFHPHRPAVTTWDRLRDSSTLNFVALDNVTARNGGTLFVPGSHLMAETDPIPDVSEALSVEAEIGDAFIMLCSTYHAGGANICEPGEADSIRTLAAVGYSIGYLRQEENQYLANNHAVIRGLPIEVQALAGWAISLPMSGWVEFATPLNLLGHEIPGGDSTFWDENQED